MCLMLCAPLDWQYAEFPSSASDVVLCSVLVRKMSHTSNQIGKKRKEKKKIMISPGNLFNQNKGLVSFPDPNTSEICLGYA